MFDDEGYGDNLPHLGYNENTTHVDVILDHLRSHSSKSRFAVELVLVTSKELGSDMSMLKHDTLDDEHSPGSFHVRTADICCTFELQSQIWYNYVTSSL